MNKPLSIKKAEFSKVIAMAINESNLPMCVVLDTLQIITAQVSYIAEQQLAKDRELWREAVLEESKEE
jgi:hypothetical protein